MGRTGRALTLQRDLHDSVRGDRDQLDIAAVGDQRRPQPVEVLLDGAAQVIRRNTRCGHGQWIGSSRARVEGFIEPGRLAL